MEKLKTSHMSHEGLSANLEVAERREYGRGVYAKSSIRVGAQLFTAEPYAYVVSESHRGVLCDSCLQHGTLQRCGHCKHVYYCGKTCQRKDWPLHKVECKGIASIRPNKPSDTMRLVIRVLLEEERKRSDNYCRGLDDLCSHEESLPESVKPEVALQVAGVRRLLEGNRELDAKKVYNTICKVMCNTFNIYDHELNPVATGLYLSAALLNHSCEPNCAVVFTGLRMSVRSIRKIEKKGQLFISYTELLETRERRQAHLKKVYSFDCKCDRCLSSENEDGLMMAAANDGVPTDQRDSAMRNGFERIDGDIKTWSRKKDYSNIASLSELLLVEYSTILHPLNIVCVKLLEELLLAQLGLFEWTKALDTAQQLTKPYQQYLSRYQQTNVLHLVRLGKLRRAIGTTEQLELSIRDLTQALELLQVSPGGDHPLTAEASLMLRDSQGELVQRRMKDLQ